jgi:hypothetical protein
LREQRVDLEGAHQSTLDALMRLQAGDVLRAQLDAARVRLQQAGDQVDQRGLARTIWADQGIACALRQRDGDVARNDQRAEALVDVAGGESRHRIGSRLAGHLSRRLSRHGGGERRHGCLPRKR